MSHFFSRLPLCLSLICLVLLSIVSDVFANSASPANTFTPVTLTSASQANDAGLPVDPVSISHLPSSNANGSNPIESSSNPNSVYAFGSYLGTGVYRAANQNATVVSIPLSFDLKKDSGSQTWLRLPISFGFFDYLAKDITEGELPSSIGTMTITPGFEHHWKASENTRMEGYLDIGFGTNFDKNDNVAIIASGISSLYDFTLAGQDAVWVSRLRFAGYSEHYGKFADQFAVLQTGVDLGLAPRWQWWDLQVQPRIFAVGYWYFNELRFISEIEQDTIVSGSYEAGFSLAFSKPLGGELLGVDRIGFSYRRGDGLNIWRLMFSFPI
ncbi:MULTISPECIES: hypothetical protein [Shewanella]|uniref:hypothetical protein n=1 Tax=Shewanella TaxID=22 RepID=UPI000D391E73|nr:MULTISPECIES: hypothetical protein [Shewanella]MCI2963465.1 hypothetical protein [Shewanella sp. N2AIL]